MVDFNLKLLKRIVLCVCEITGTLYFYVLIKNEFIIIIIEPVHEISNNVVCATSKASDQPAHSRSLIRAFACRLNIL